MAKRGPQCRALSSLGYRCVRRQNHVGNCWSEWMHRRYPEDIQRFRYKWRRHGMKWTF